MLHIEHNLLGELWKHASEQYPCECCGVLLGTRAGRDERFVKQVARCTNVHPLRESHYTISPGDLISSQRNARDQKLEIVGFYHSHPDHPPTPSATDLDEAFWNECSYLILSIVNGVAQTARSFCLAESGGVRKFEVEALVEAARS